MSTPPVRLGLTRHFLPLPFSLLLLTSFSVAGRLILVCGTLFVLTVEFAHGEGNYQSTRDGKTLIWNSNPKPGDVATWTGDRDRADYAHGFGRLVWYTLESGADKPELYARYWGRMVNGKFEGPVNVHAKRKTHYAIFIDGIRATPWSPGTAPLGATARWRKLVATRRPHVEPVENLRRTEPEAPAAGPEAEQRTELTSQRSVRLESIQDLYTEERWPKIDIDDSLRLLAFPPRTLRK